MQKGKFKERSLRAAIKISDDLDHVLEKFHLHKALRVCAWVSRFIRNCQHPLEKIQGPPVDTGNHHMQTLLD